MCTHLIIKTLRELMQSIPANTVVEAQTLPAAGFDRRFCVIDKKKETLTSATADPIFNSFFGDMHLGKVCCDPLIFPNPQPESLANDIPGSRYRHAAAVAGEDNMEIVEHELDVFHCDWRSTGVHGGRTRGSSAQCSMRSYTEDASGRPSEELLEKSCQGKGHSQGNLR